MGRRRQAQVGWTNLTGAGGGRWRAIWLVLTPSLLAGCAEPNANDPLACAPAFAPGTGAYRACMLPQSANDPSGNEENTSLAPPPPPAACIPLGIDSTCN